METREVTFKYYNSSKREMQSGKGEFHKWGSDIGSEDDKYFQITFAVVEDDNGQVHRIPENCVQFQQQKEL